MARWREVEEQEPEFAAAVRERLDAHRHKIIATLRKDGAPRVSGIEATFADGDLWLGMMPGSLKGADLRRDPRMALHGASEDPSDDPEVPGWTGDAKLSGRAVEVTDPEEVARAFRAMGAEEHAGSGDLFRVEIDDVVLTRLADSGDHLVIETWKPGAPLKRVARR